MLVEVAQLVGLVAGILLGLGVIARAAVGAWKMVRSLVRLADLVERIHQEFLPNHGHSLTDRVVRIDHNVQTNARNIETIYGVVLKGHEVDPVDAPLLETLTYEP